MGEIQIPNNLVKDILWSLNEIGLWAPSLETEETPTSESSEDNDGFEVGARPISRLRNVGNMSGEFCVCKLIASTKKG